MQIKRYEVLSINEGMAKIKDDLGPNAIILSSRRLRRKKKSFIEIFAARDDFYNSSSELKKYRKSDSTISDNSELLSYFKTEIDQLKDLIIDTKRRMDIHFELAELKDNLNILFDIFAINESKNLPKYLSKLYYHLISSGISTQHTIKIIEKLKNNYPEDYLKDDQYVSKIVQDIIKNSIITSYKDVERKRIISFIGATGSGKTTTLAKLAAKYLFTDKLKVGILTTDTYRIGATEQLKMYAEIMDIPIQIVSKKEKLKRYLELFADKDVIFIDTPGKNYKDKNYLMDLRKLFSIDSSIEINLILNITTDQKNMLKIADSFDIIDYDNIIFTKLDEANNFGAIYNIIDYVDKPVSYVTNGQNVPQDIERVDPDRLAQIIVKNTLINTDLY